MSATARFISLEEAAQTLGRSRAWLYAKRRDLEQLGFPRPHPIVKKYDKLLVMKWCDTQAGVFSNDNVRSEVDEAFDI